jgi:hypothetical protein
MVDPTAYLSDIKKQLEGESGKLWYQSRFWTRLGTEIH